MIFGIKVTKSFIFSLIVALITVLWPMPQVGTSSGAFRVLVVEDRKAEASLPPAMSATLTAKEIRDYLKAHCAAEDGLPGYRFLDQDDELTAEPQWVKDLAGKGQGKKRPTWMLYKGTRVTTVERPADTKAALSALEKVGGK